MQRAGLLIGIGFFLIVGGLLATARWLHLNTEQVLIINGAPLLVERATTPAEQARGLARRWCRLSDEEGMYFVYPELNQPTFWMKDMHFSIDILWLANGEVVGVEQHVQPDGGDKRYQPVQLVDRVLEVRAGWISRHHIEIGTRVEELP